MKNTVILMGVRLGQDCVLKYLPSGTAVSEFSVAYRKKTQQGERISWFQCKVWGKSAEHWSEHLKKGTKWSILGELEENAFTTKDGQKVSRIYINVEWLEPTSSTTHNTRTIAPETTFDGPTSLPLPKDPRANFRAVMSKMAISETTPLTDEDVPF